VTDGGGLTGDATDGPDNWYGRTTGRLTDGVTTVRFESVLPLSVVEVLLESPAPFDPEVQPTEVDGPGRSRRGRGVSRGGTGRR
jgi:hypothetical protein